MRETLEALADRFAFQTSVRFDLLATEHVPYAELARRDVEGTLLRAIERAEGVIAVTGRMGSGKSSVIASVTQNLDEAFVPIRVSVVDVEAGSPTAFARHAMVEIGALPAAALGRHERLALERATAVGRVIERSRELRTGFIVRGGVVLTAGVVADLKQTAKEQLEHPTDPADVVSGLQRLFDTFWKVGRCPVLIVDDTDHWGGSPGVAEAFFDQTARALSRLDVVTVVAAQTGYTRLDGYRRVREAFTAEIELPAFADAAAGVERILQRRVDVGGVDTVVTDLFEPDAFSLAVASYEQSVSDGRGGDVRRTLWVVRSALELALEDPSVERIGPGHLQEAMARNPVAESP